MKFLVDVSDKKAQAVKRLITGTGATVEETNSQIIKHNLGLDCEFMKEFQKKIDDAVLENETLKVEVKEYKAKVEALETEKSELEKKFRELYELSIQTPEAKEAITEQVVENPKRGRTKKA